MNAAASARARLPLLEPLRILASVAVVHHHMSTGFLLGIGFGLPLFLLLLFGLSSSGAPEHLGAFARRKARFLLVPWLRWSLFYVAFLVLGDLVRGRAPLGRLGPGMLLYGGHLSLWFLPFAAVAVTVAKAMQRVAAGVACGAALLVAALLAGVWTEVVVPLAGDELPRLARCWLRSSPGILWGVALGQSLRAPRLGTRRVWLGALALVAIGLYLVSPSAQAPDSIARQYAVAVPLACLGFAWTPSVPAFLPALSSLCFGIYLIHSLVGKVLGSAFPVAAWPAAGHTAVAWGLSALLVAGLRRTGLGWHELAAREPRRARGAGPLPIEALPGPVRKSA